MLNLQSIIKLFITLERRLREIKGKHGYFKGDKSMGNILTVGSSGATYTTIAAAINNASSGDSIVLYPGNYTENPAFISGISLFSYGGATICGKCSFTFTGTFQATNVIFKTNGDFALSLSGSNSPQITLNNCSIIANDHTAINLSASGSTASLFATGCVLSIANTGYTFYDMSAGNNIHFMNCFMNNPAGSTAASNNSTGNALIEYSTCFGSFSNSSTGSFGAFNCNIDTSGIPTTPIYITGTGSNLVSNCYVGAGSVVCYYVTSGKTLTVAKTFSNTSNSIYTGGGTVTIIN